METVRFVGRDAVLAEVAAAVGRAREARGGLVLLTGTAGAGKTSAAEEAVRRAEGCRVVWAWCPPAGAGGAYRPWSWILRELAAADARCGQAVAASAPLRSLIAGRGAAPTARDPEAARLRLTGDVAEVLRLGGASVPLLVVLDDLHDADPSSLRLLQDLVSTLRTSGVVVLATLRDDPAVWPDPARLGHRAALLRQALVLPLGPLTEDDVSVLLSAATGRAADQQEVRFLLRRTGGDAFFVGELLRDRALAPDSDVPHRVPPSVRAAVQARLAQLPDSCTGLLGVASAMGTRFRLDVLAEVTGVPLGEIGPALAPAAAAGLLASAEPGSGRFRHDIMRESVRDALTGGDPAALHGRVADVLAAFARRGRDVEPAEIAGHLLEAGAAHADAAAEYAWQAADRAAGLLAFDEAVRWYEHCERAARPAAWPTERRAALFRALGAARLGAGDRAAARTAYLRSAALAREAGRPDLLAEAALGLGAGATGFEVDLLDREQIDLLEEARKALDPGRRSLPEEIGEAPDPSGQGLPAEPGEALDPRRRSLLAGVVARLSVATTLVETEEHRLALAEEAVGMARAGGDLGVLAYALSALCDARSGPDDCARRKQWAEEIVASARQLHDLPLELLGRRFRLVALLETGAMAEAEREAVAYGAAARLLHQPLYEWYVPLWRGMRALMEGRHDVCRAALAQAAEIGARAASGNAAMLVDTQRWCLAAEEDDREGLAEVATALPPPDELGGVWPRVAAAIVAAQLGRPEEAADRLTAVAPRLPDAPRDSEWLPMLGQVAETVGLIGPHPVAMEVYGLLKPYADLFVVEGIGAYVRGPVQRHLALLARAIGDEEAAREHFAAALRRVEAVGAAGLAARIAREAGQVDSGRAAGQRAAASSETGDLIRAEGESWVLRFSGREVRVRDSKGLHDLATLLTRPGTPVPALDLVVVGSGRDAAAGVAEAGLHEPGDLGELVDARAREAYRRRLDELAADAEEADAAGDSERSARIAVERDALVEQLTAAYGLGGRVRRAGSPAERARTAVTARLRAAIERIAEVHPELGRHLRTSVRTGTVCVYDPEAPRRWGR